MLDFKNPPAKDFHSSFSYQGPLQLSLKKTRNTDKHLRLTDTVIKTNNKNDNFKKQSSLSLLDLKITFMQ